MYKPYKKMKEPLHFVGIGGIGMSGIAEVLARLGFPVSGSDAQDSATVQRLRDLGVRICIGHKAENLGDAKVLVLSSAIAATNPEVIEAKKRGLSLVPRAEMLAELMRLKYGVGVAGTHGKTSTTSMIGAILSSAELDPTIIVGGKVASLGGANAKLGEGPLLVAEADESDGSFLKLSPIVAVITNIDNDHLDHYGGMGELRRSFLEYANKVPYYGRTILCSDDAEITTLLPQIQKPHWTYGFNAKVPGSVVSHFQITDYSALGSGSQFKVQKDGQFLCEMTLAFPGRHYALNATAALAVALELDVELSAAVKALALFAGVGRRFETKGFVKGTKVPIIDDYGHHPTEIQATITAAREHCSGKQRVVVAFQPHRYSRTKICWQQFAPSLKNADLVLLMDIYAAGEAPLEGIESSTLCAAIKQQGYSHVEHSGGLEETKNRLLSLLRDGDTLITLGAGSVTQLAGLLM